MTGPTTSAAARVIPGRPAGDPVPAVVLDLLAAIRDAADVPLPGLDEADERAYHALMGQRLSDLHIALSVALSPQWIGTLDLADEVAAIRSRVDATPVTYTRYVRPEQDGGV